MKALRLIGKVLKALRYPALSVVLIFVLSILWIMYFVKDIPPVNDKDLRTRPACHIERCKRLARPDAVAGAV